MLHELVHQLQVNGRGSHQSQAFRQFGVQRIALGGLGFPQNVLGSGVEIEAGLVRAVLTDRRYVSYGPES